MSDLTSNSNTPAKRGPGRPRKVREEAQLTAPPTDPVRPLATNRRGAAQIIGKSVSHVKRLERNDPDWPKPFAIGVWAENYLIADVEAYLLRKASAAKSSAAKA
jgi:predicted DNA-binding transcriptional regulator AlpA